MEQRLEKKVIANITTLIKKTNQLLVMEDLEARMALEREPELVQAVADAEAERDAALMQVAAHEALAVKHFKHLDMVRAELEKTKIELQKAQSVLKEIGAKIERGN